MTESGGARAVEKIEQSFALLEPSEKKELGRMGRKSCVIFWGIEQRKEKRGDTARRGWSQKPEKGEGSGGKEAWGLRRDEKN